MVNVLSSEANKDHSRHSQYWGGFVAIDIIIEMDQEIAIRSMESTSVDFLLLNYELFHRIPYPIWHCECRNHGSLETG